MKNSTIALVMGAAMALASSAAMAETSGSENKPQGNTFKNLNKKQASLAPVARKKTTRKRRVSKVSGKRSVRRASNVSGKRSVRRVSKVSDKRSVQRASKVSDKRSVQRVSKVSGKRSVRRGKYLPLAKRLKPAGLPISLVDAVITMESGYNPSARGAAGEVGLMQVKPATARMVRSLTGVRAGKLSVPANNLRVGMAYLNWCYKRAKRNVAATIGCYNAGPGNMWKWQKFAVTRKYVRFVRTRVK